VLLQFGRHLLVGLMQVLLKVIHNGGVACGNERGSETGLARAACATNAVLVVYSDDSEKERGIMLANRGEYAPSIFCGMS
jgi:hypothetical protein